MPLAEKIDPVTLADGRFDAGFDSWLQTLPKDNWKGAVNESDFTDVEWVDSVGFVERGA